MLTAATSSTGGLNNSYSYNANGQQTGRTLAGIAYTLAFDYDGQMTSLTHGSTVTSYAYDASGRRVSRAASGTTTDFYYGGGHILAEKQGGTTSAVYTYGNSLVRKDGEYPLFDGLGSERTVTNSSQTVTGTINYDGFGNTVGSTGSSTDPYMYGASSGYRTEGDAGLSLVGARYYDPQVGRFITSDTDLSQKPYLYCEHDPVNKVDPDGHRWKWWQVAMAVGIVLAITAVVIATAGGAAAIYAGGAAVASNATFEGAAAWGAVGWGETAVSVGNVARGLTTAAKITAGVGTVVGGIGSLKNLRENAGPPFGR